jgi:DNA-binding MarR family transcriptional regulator
MSRADTIRDLEHEVGVMIRRIRRVIAVRAREVHESLQPASYLILSHLADSGPMRASSIVEHFDIDKGAISRQVSHLIELDLVECTQDPDDGRARLLSVTDEARRRLEDVGNHRRKLVAERLGDWPERDLARFVDDLARYNAALTES